MSDRQEKADGIVSNEGCGNALEENKQGNII